MPFLGVETKDNFLPIIPLNNGQFFISKTIKLQFQNHFALSIPGHTPLHLELEGCLLLKNTFFPGFKFQDDVNSDKDMIMSVSNWQLLTLHLQESYLQTWMWSRKMCYTFSYVKYSIHHLPLSQESSHG